MRNLLKYRWIKAIGVGMGVYAFLAILMWFISWYEYNASYSVPLEKYARKHSEQIKTEIFGEIFSQAAECLKLKTDDDKRFCQNGIRQKMGQLIVEEEFSFWGSSVWPNDLYFVKQSGDNYLALGWGGVLENVKVANMPNSVLDSWHYEIRHALNRCRFFEYLQPETAVCQVYQKFSLPNNESGYMVRHISLDNEDTNLLLNFIWPFIVISNIAQGDLALMSSMGKIVALIPIVGLVAGLIAWIRQKKN